MKEPARLLVSLLSATTVAVLAPASVGASEEVAPDLEPTLVVAPDGDDSAAGSLDDPFATVQHAVDLAGPGDVISVRGGTYALDDQNITIDTSGTSDEPITLTAQAGEERAQAVFTLTVVGADLPEQKLTYTQWFYADCIASYYGVPVYSQRHWELLEASGCTHSASAEPQCWPLASSGQAPEL